MKIRLLLLFTGWIALCLIACQPEKPNNIPTEEETTSLLKKGNWMAELRGDSIPLDTTVSIPFQLKVVSDQKVIIQNGEEEIEITDIQISENQVKMILPVFGSILRFTNQGDTWYGAWENTHKKDYTLFFEAKHSSLDTSSAIASDIPILPKRWKVTFSPGTPDAYPAIGLFETTADGRATGTFMTETGDYRYLAGTFNGKYLELSCFDGAHAFLFWATLDESGNLKGTFCSGKHWSEPWVATPSEDFQLAEMDKLTYLKEGYEKIAFELPNTNQDTVSLADAQFRDKPVIVQIMGTWCPNCMDETRFLVEMYQQYHPQGLEIVAIDFEVIDTWQNFEASAKRMKEDLGVQYPILYGGYANKKSAAKTLPMLNHIMSYPTSIFIDKNGEVKAIHTGFAGPSTGIVYDQYVAHTRQLIEEMVK